jgi:hypothetical protein
MSTPSPEEAFKRVIAHAKEYGFIFSRASSTTD